VALKLMAPEVAQDPGIRQRFIAESRLAAAIDHPNILPLYEAGIDAEVPAPVEEPTRVAPPARDAPTVLEPPSGAPTRNGREGPRPPG